MQALKFSRRSFLKSGAAAAAASVLPGVSLPVQAAVAPLSAQARTQYGPVQGTENDGVFCWYGVPYAAAPVGEARWTAPQEPSAWASVRDCSAPASPAFQYASCALGSEDCLKLDLFAPADARSAPVLVYLHSGGNQTGSSGEVSGAEIARQLGCVFVGAEYRLGLLGWNCLPALCPAADDTGNFALLDMAKALDWVKENIAAFGGDGQNVTLFGFSAGSRDALALLASPLGQGRFQRVVACSGGMTLADPGESAQSIAAALAPLAVEDGKARTAAVAQNWLLTSDPAVRDWLCGVEAARLAAKMAGAGLRMGAFPHLYADGVTLPQSWESAAYQNVPVMLLSGTTEFSFARWDAFFASETAQAFPAEELEQAKQFAVRYGSALYRAFNAQTPAGLLAGRTGAPVYLAQADYGAPGSGTEIPLLGSFHGIFLPMLSTSNAYTAWADFSQAGFAEMAGQFRRSLRNFLTSGDPNGKTLVSGAPRWQPWSQSAPLVLSLDATADAALVRCQEVHTGAAEVRAALDADGILSPALKQAVIENVLQGRFFF